MAGNLATANDDYIARNLVTDPKLLVPGVWYCCVIADDDGGLDFGGAILARFDGEGCWTDWDGEPRDRLWDPSLQMEVSMEAADGYLAQA